MLSKNKIKLIRSLEQKKRRREEGLFVAEGPKVVGDLLEAGYKAKLLVCTNQYFSKRHLAVEEVIEVSDDELRKVSFLQHPQDVLGVFEIPNTSALHTPDPQSLCIALDGVQDPGNLGTIIRIADWFGINQIFCSTDTADAFNPKTVQATMGSIARVIITYTDLRHSSRRHSCLWHIARRQEHLRRRTHRRGHNRNGKRGKRYIGGDKAAHKQAVADTKLPARKKDRRQPQRSNSNGNNL